MRAPTMLPEDTPDVRMPDGVKLARVYVQAYTAPDAMPGRAETAPMPSAAPLGVGWGDSAPGGAVSRSAATVGYYSLPPPPVESHRSVLARLLSRLLARIRAMAFGPER